MRDKISSDSRVCRDLVSALYFCRDRDDNKIMQDTTTTTQVIFASTDSRDQINAAADRELRASRDRQYGSTQASAVRRKRALGRDQEASDLVALCEACESEYIDDGLVWA